MMESMNMRNTKRNIPKITTGPHAASSKAICCVPNGIGVGRRVATSITVEMHARNCTAIKVLNDRTSVKANGKNQITHTWNIIILHTAGARLGDRRDFERGIARQPISQKSG